MKEPWANAPSLEHEFMSLKKNLDLINLKKKKMIEAIIFENKCVGHVEMPQFNPKTKKNSFWVLNDPKKMSENTKLHGRTMEGLHATGHMRSAIWHIESANQHF